MLQKTDLAKIAVEVAQESRLTILNLLHQKNPAIPFDPLILATFETRLRDFIFASLCLRFLQGESREAFFARMSMRRKGRSKGQYAN
jgi:hypothetical protein